jgi:hypothetical protein
MIAHDNYYSQFYHYIIIINFMQILIPNCWFENVLPAYFGTEI